MTHTENAERCAEEQQKLKQITKNKKFCKMGSLINMGNIYAGKVFTRCGRKPEDPAHPDKRRDPIADILSDQARIRHGTATSFPSSDTLYTYPKTDRTNPYQANFSAYNRSRKNRCP